MNGPGRVLITGAGKGLGCALVRRFLHANWHVFAGLYKEDLDSPRFRTADGSRCTTLRLDATDPGSVRAAAARTHEAVPALDVLVKIQPCLEK